MTLTNTDREIVQRTGELLLAFVHTLNLFPGEDPDEAEVTSPPFLREVAEGVRDDLTTLAEGGVPARLIEVRGGSVPKGAGSPFPKDRRLRIVVQPAGEGRARLVVSQERKS